MARLVLLLLALVLASGLVAAPVPKPKAVKKKEVKVPHVGTWDMAWKGGKGRVTFHAEGGYELHGWAGSQTWLGRWEMRAGKLWVEEWQPRNDGMPPAPITWEIELDATGLAGKVDGEAKPSFGLTVPKPDA